MSRIYGLTLKGIDALPVEVEVCLTGGLFSISIVGLADTAIKEARERVRISLGTLGIKLKGHVSVNLAPADLPKEGSLLDLPIAVGIAREAGFIPEGVGGIFMGELALDGRLRQVRGGVPAAFLARQMGLPLFAPRGNAVDVSMVEGVEAYACSNIAELFCHLRGERPLQKLDFALPEAKDLAIEPDFADIRGQAAAKRGLEIAAAGSHGVIFVGSPGSGKTMLARAIRGILPPLSDDELIEVMRIRSARGMHLNVDRTRPFRAVHHTASVVAICGGGVDLKPGELSLAHRGVLFLDEITEFRRDVLESLRQPLEDGSITVSRASGTVTYPASVLLVAACNPCPCGYLGDVVKSCSCSPSDIDRYAKKLSGPILDRIDIHLQVPRLTPEELLELGGDAENSLSVKKRVMAARAIQLERWHPFGINYNAELSEKMIKRHLGLTKEAKMFIKSVGVNFNLTGRGLSRVLKIARTIADLAGEKNVRDAHLAEALTYRGGTVLER
ncbi:Mg chelatase-related protein [Acetomicrobium mobile DSM 13181]|uniref:Mg chelatase-related protein n=1 Tax=Acetomicrobium mobile (strain ATCC BAA-54 / DSM 13181 / JCM 12221 / NGA) TaxID=891968 RepID=I4BUF3_ACEMN|nr:YifB family Mg chelatase-like AAA ATPase [Acetomicrobium mobile]AFM20910.1 Mg chelatase-related protein [Acetomicrobium mobile DSM 13181]